MQQIRFKKSVYQAVANMEERSLMKDGDVVHRPYRSRMRVTTYTRGTSATLQDDSGTDESLTIDQSKIIAFYVDDLDKLQSKYEIVNRFADDAATELEIYIDGQFLGEIANATNTVDAGDVGGTSGTSISLSTSNVVQMFAAAAKKLNRQNIPQEGRFAVVSPTVYQTLVERLESKDTTVGDQAGMNGKVGIKFMGFEVYLSNNLYWTGKWTPADQPSNSDTLTINGVTLTFVTGTPTNPGDIKSETSTAVTLDNLVAFLNDPASSISGKSVALTSVSNLRALSGAVATDGTTYLGLAIKGAGEIDVSASSAADVWSLETVHQYFGLSGQSTDLVIQKMPSVEFRMPELKLGRNVLVSTLYGLKTFAEGALAMVDVKVDSSTF